MTYFNDASRPRSTTGLPCWTTCPQVALPRLYIKPIVDSIGIEWWRVEIMVANGNEGRFSTTNFTQTGLLEFLIDWKTNPERALEMWFDTKPPTWTPRQVHPESDSREAPRRETPRPSPSLALDIKLF